MKSEKIEKVKKLLRVISNPTQKDILEKLIGHLENDEFESAMSMLSENENAFDNFKPKLNVMNDLRFTVLRLVIEHNEKNIIPKLTEMFSNLLEIFRHIKNKQYGVAGTLLDECEKRKIVHENLIFFLRLIITSLNAEPSKASLNFFDGIKIYLDKSAEEISTKYGEKAQGVIEIIKETKRVIDEIIQDLTAIQVVHEFYAQLESILDRMAEEK